MYLILLLVMRIGSATAGQLEYINISETGSSFREYYTRAIIIRFNDSKSNVTAATTTPVRTMGLQSHFGIMKDAWKRYEKSVEIGELEQVGRNGTTDAMVEMAAKEIWERSGGKLVTKVAEIVGPKMGASFCRYLGGAIGIACGTLFPPLQVPLVIGGVFIGGNLGRVIGFVAGQIAANVVNSMIADKIISPQLKKGFEVVLRKWLNDSSRSGDVTCRSDICAKGYTENKCKCVECWKGSDYSDRSGLSTCKKCTPGKIPFKCDRSSAANCGCKDCRNGYYGADGSTCKLCSKEMEYSDAKGLVSCKKCKIGSIPYRCRSNSGHCGCSKCSPGKYGTMKGHCVPCYGDMEYSDTEGSTSCKKCSVGSIPYGCRSNSGHCGCSKCSPGKYGTMKGHCVPCYGDMEYSDTEGSTSCKKCSVGSIPNGCYSTSGHCSCSKCSRGKFGTEKGHCVPCNGDMEYSDTEGSTSCKKCSVGSIPNGCYSTSGHCSCSKCSRGKFGTEKGHCVPCNGHMEYSDTEGSTSCKKCSVGSIPYKCGYNYGNCGCNECNEGSYGSLKGTCLLCDGAMEYSNEKGATSCKKCPAGTRAYRCQWHYGNCGCQKN